jgi:CheY-like chemotaxis protein
VPFGQALIIDDNPINLELLQLLVEAEGFEVTAVTGAEEALSVLDRFVPELFIVDVQLPGMSGLDLLRLLRSRPDTARACAIIVTSYAMDADKENAFAAGCDGYITKPIDTRTFGPDIVAIYTDTLAHNSRRH